MLSVGMAHNYDKKVDNFVFIYGDKGIILWAYAGGMTNFMHITENFGRMLKT